MAEQTQLQQVMTKDPQKVEVGKRLAEYNHRKREELAKAQKSRPKLTSSQYYGTEGHYGCCGIRHSWLLHSLIQERRCHQGDSGSPIQGRRHPRVTLVH